MYKHVNLEQIICYILCPFSSMCVLWIDMFFIVCPTEIYFQVTGRRMKETSKKEQNIKMKREFKCLHLLPLLFIVAPRDRWDTAKTSKEQKRVFNSDLEKNQTK